MFLIRRGGGNGERDMRVGLGGEEGSCNYDLKWKNKLIIIWKNLELKRVCGVILCCDMNNYFLNGGYISIRGKKYFYLMEF